MKIQERIERLRGLMEERGIDAYLIPTSDFHESEYVGDHFKCRQYMTGFTGSAGTALITAEEALLWTDGRYFVQAAGELRGTGVTLMKMGREEVPTVAEYLAAHMPENGKLGFDGRVVNGRLAEELSEALEECGAEFACREDLVGLIWEDRPPLSAEPIWILEERYCGKPADEKIDELRSAMRESQAQAHILTTLDDIAWLLNLRGGDVKCNPVFLSFAILTEESLDLYVQEEALNDQVRAYLEGLGVTVRPYEEIYEAAGDLPNGPLKCAGNRKPAKKVLLERGMVNYAILDRLSPDIRIVDAMNPTAPAKARKHPVEIDNLKKAHIRDGVIMTRFIRWLKTQIGKTPMDELSVRKRLDSMRREAEGNLGLSFSTISAYGPNAAICHYSATEESSVRLEARGLYLVDSGGQYYEGTTDVTRTVVLGPLTDEEREHFTLTVMSMLRLGHVKFLKGCRGVSLDYTAREPLWSRGIDFDHGTGHGVGYLLNVHERPVGIRYKIVPERQDSCVLEEGMVTSDEPGVYIEGKHGVRTENLMFCKEAETNEFGQFLEFEFLTYVPIDLDGIDRKLMEEKDIRYLNEYHRAVREKLSPYLNEEEREWLKEYTRAI